MPVTLLTTKFYFPPARPDLVPRPRLVDRFNAGVKGPVTLVSAPAGYGKTSLLSEWRTSDLGRSFPVAWLSLDPDDNELTRFLAYLITAIGIIKPGFGEITLASLQTPQPPPNQQILTNLINELNEFEHPFVLVLDDYHVISTQSIHEALLFLVEHLPAQLHLAILSRADPPLPLGRLRARQQLTEIRAHDLHFTTDEASAFLNKVMKLGLSTDEVAALTTHTEGWIAGLQLAALSMSGREDVSDFIAAFTGSHHYIMDYLVEEVLHQQPKPLQEFLLQTSILERFTGKLCEAVTGQSNGEATLKYLEQANLFLIPLDDNRRWYRYHKLFADMLRNHLRVVQETEILALHHKASVWFESHQLAEEAIAHAIAEQDPHRAALLVEQNALDMIQRGEIYTLLRYIQKLPENTIQNRPWLCVFVAWIRYHYGPRNETIQYIELAEKALQAAAWITESERKQIASFMAAIQALKAMHDEDVPYALEMARKANDLAPEWDFVSRISAVTLAKVCWARGDVIGAEKAMHQSVLIAQKLNDLSHAISGKGYEAIHQIKQARLQDAYNTLNDALALGVLPDGREQPNSAFVYIRLADLAREWNNLESADQHIRKASKMLFQTGSPDYRSDACIVHARICLAQNDLPNARQALEMAQKLARGTQLDPYIITWLEEGWIRLWLAEGNLPAAINWADHSGLTPEGPFSYLKDLEHINLARVWVAQSGQNITNHLPEALRLLDRLHQAAESTGWIHETIKVCILKSLACQVANDNQGALSAISQALTLAEPAGYVRLFLDEGASMARLLRLAGSRGITPKYIYRLITEFENDLNPSRAIEQPMPGLLSKRELEVLHLIAAGYSNKEIAKELVLASATVKRHTANIFIKLDVKNRTEAVARAREIQLL